MSSAMLHPSGHAGGCPSTSLLARPSTSLLGNKGPAAHLLLWVGLGAGDFFLLGGIILGFAVDSGWRYLTLLDIPAFGCV